MRVLCVAEKPSIARSISQILSGGQHDTRTTRNKFIKNFDFHYPQTQSTFTVTSVSGHLMEYDFGTAHRSWQSCDPFTLFDAPVEAKVASSAKTIEQNLMNEARRADTLMIWTDCDREGENIGAEVAKICRKANPRIRVNRARFSAIIAQQIHHAAQHPVELDQAQADAVEARTILDLRLGAAFTRMQTLNLQRRFTQIQEAGGPISYGPCQFPTLGFVVSRYEQVHAFEPETFWYIYLSLTRPSSSGKSGKGAEEETEFSWKRNHLFDFYVSLAIYEGVLENPAARVTRKLSKGTKKYKPLPLTTVELQKAGSRLLRLAPKRVLDVAEKLYQQGVLSYPRTETDQYDPKFDFMSLIAKQTSDPNWGAFASQLQQGGFNVPRKGKKNDKAHPPIHPTGYAGDLVGDEKKVYEFVTRRFLASCAKDAEGQETTIDVTCGGEQFTAKGLIVLERNYLEVYPYDKWTGKYLPNFEEGEEFVPSVCELREGQTTQPKLLTEADLVGLMDKNGIGTDATIAQHIQTIVDRGYVLERMEGQVKYLVPSTLGIGLVEGYNEIGFDKSLSKPQLRRDTERSMVEVCERTKTKTAMLDQSIEQYKEVFIRARREFDKVISSVGRHIEGGGRGNNQPRDDGAGRGGGGRGRGRGGGRGGGRGDNDDDDDDEGGSGRGGRRGGAASSRGRGGKQPSSKGGRGGAKGANSRNAPPGPQPPGPDPKPLSRIRQPSPKFDDFDDIDEEIILLDNFAPSSVQPSKQPNPPARPPPQPLQMNSLSSSAGPQCRCNMPASERTVVKEGANKGRRFWTCANSGKCGFFEWMDGPSSTPLSRTSSNLVPMRNVGSETSHFNSRNNKPEIIRRCKCDLTAVVKTVVREGPNQGRKFWVCPNHEKARCGFFEWDDGTGNTEDQMSTVQNSGRSQPQGECYKCGEPGHWANACPNGQQTARNRTTSMGSSVPGNTTSNSCFKCGREGHYSNSCPNSSKQNENTWDAPNTSGACFKCGDEGHFSNACPNGESTHRPKSKRGRGGGSVTRTSSNKRTKTKSRFAAADSGFL